MFGSGDKLCDLKSFISDPDREYFISLISDGKRVFAIKECMEKCGLSIFKAKKVIDELAKKIEESKDFISNIQREEIENKDLIFEDDFKEQKSESIDKIISGKPTVIINGDIYKYLFTCQSCLNEIVIKTNGGRYGNLGPFNCPVCNEKYYATIDDNPNLCLYVAKLGEQPASLFDDEGRKRSIKIPPLQCK